MNEVKTDKAPKVIGPYSQAIQAGNFIFCSGQLGVDPISGDLVGSDIANQTKQALENIRQILLAESSGLDAVVKTEVYLKNMSDYKIMNEVYEQAFTVSPKPARVTVEVARLPKDALVEIACVAYKETVWTNYLIWN